MSKEQDDNGWLDPRAAEGQLLQVEKALKKDPLDVPPFRAFLEAMRYIDIQHGTLIDVGCGVGGYAALVDRFFPYICYLGYDISPHMIELARKHFGFRFFVRDALELELGATIILASSLIETCPNWRHVLQHLCSLQFRWLILNRIRLWNDPDHPATERVYTTIYKVPSFEAVHNLGELTELIGQAGAKITHTIIYQAEPETRLVCLLLEKGD